MNKVQDKPWLRIGLSKARYKALHKRGYYSGKLGASISTNPCHTDETKQAWEEGYRVGLLEREAARDKRKGL